MTVLVGQDPELVPPMPGMSMVTCDMLGAAVAEAWLDIFTAGDPFDWRRAVERTLRERGIQVYPADASELGSALGATDPTGERDIGILLRTDLYDAVDERGGKGNLARATLLHELGHASAHVPYLRRLLRRRPGIALHRVERRTLRPYNCPEWQAWSIGGSIRLPRTLAQKYSREGASLMEISRDLEISADFVRNHLRRLKVELMPESEVF